MEQFFGIIALAVLIEGIVTYVTELTKEFKPQLIAPILLGIAVAIAYGLDIPAALGITANVPLIGNILTGVIMARGSNYLYDIIGRLTNQPAAGLPILTRTKQ